MNRGHKFDMETRHCCHERKVAEFSECFLQDHLHVYQSDDSNSISTDFMVPFHKDKGMILFLTPFTSNPLIIKDKFDKTITTEDLKVRKILIKP